MTPCSERTLGSPDAMVTSKALEAVYTKTGSALHLEPL